MKCPGCGAPRTQVVETRCPDGKTTFRRHGCGCGTRWKTTQKVDADSVTIPHPELEFSPYVGKGAVAQLPTGGQAGGPPLGSEYLGSGSESDPDPEIRPDLYKLTKQNTNTMGVSLFARVMALFCKLWGEKYGRQYFPTKPDRNQLGSLLQGTTPDALGEIHYAFVNYLDDNSPWVAQNHRHSLMWFCTSGGFNKYRVKASVISDKENRSIQAASQWASKKRVGGRRPAVAGELFRPGTPVHVGCGGEIVDDVCLLCREVAS